MKYDSEERFPIVNDQGETIGSATRKECHSGLMLLHPVVHLHVIRDSDGAFLLQKRAMTKDIQPGKWDTAVGGHVDLNETFDDALLRESAEELGIDASLAEKLTSYIFQSERERELVNVYIIRVHDDFIDSVSAAADEIDSVRFWTRQEIAEAEGRGILTPNFESEYHRIIPLIKR